MKKIYPFLIIGILVLSSIGAVAETDGKQMEKEPMNIQDWQLIIDIKGGFFGYTVRVTNEGGEPVSGNLTINITTDAGFMLLGRELSETPDVIEALPPDEYVEFKMGPVLGFGFADITITGVFTPIDDPYPFEMEATNGFVLLFFVRCGLTPITIPATP